MCVLTFPMKNPQKTKIHLECRDNEWNTDCHIDWKTFLEAIMWPNLIFIRFILIEYPCWCWKVFFCCALIGDNSNDLNETSATNWVEMGKLIKLRNVEVFTRPTPVSRIQWLCPKSPASKPKNWAAGTCLNFIRAKN